MIPTDMKHIFVRELVRICESPSSSGKLIAVSTLIRRVENRYGLGFCRGIDEDELRNFIRDASGL